MNAEIIAVGSEMLTPSKIDTNSLYLTDRLNVLGIEVVQKMIVGDDRRRLTESIAQAIERSDVILLSGGLGPTEDDLTREATADATGRKLIFSQELCDWLAALFAKFGRKMAENNKRQAYLIEGAEVLPNERGTAPGQYLEHHRKHIFLLPGPPKEIKPMFEAQVYPRLEKLMPPLVIRTRHLRIAGMGESDVDQLVAPVYTQYSNPVTTILASLGDISLHFRARFAEQAEADRVLDEVVSRIKPLLGDRIYSENGDSLEETIHHRLLARGETAGVAESCTGGNVGAHLSSVPGSSQSFAGGFITYTNAMKQRELGVPAEMIAEHGPVSEPVAKAMAEGARAKLGIAYAVSVTGYAGPDGGTEAEPVGAVYIAVASAHGTSAKRFQFHGERERIRALATQYALDTLRRAIPGSSI